MVKIKREREMKKFVSWMAVCLISMPALAVTPAGQSRRSMASQMVMTAPRGDTSVVTEQPETDAAARATASTNQITAMANANALATGAATVDMSSVRVPVGGGNDNSSDGDDQDDNDNDNNNNAEYEKQKQACLSNNIGMGNTFVWASRYSNTNNYSSMVEDLNNPENNVCFVLVEVKSADPKINVSDVPTKYFQMGQNITCGNWADEETLRGRILDAKKSGRTWATVGGAVGGAGVGVGLMELFGNRLIGGAVMGQKALEGDEQLLAQLRALKNQHPAEFNEFMDALEDLKKECDAWQGDNKPSECNQFKYDRLSDANN